MNMKCGTQKIVKVSSIMAIIMGAISLHAWQCPDCQKAHENPFCPQTYKDKDGLTPSDYPYAGAIADNASVHDTPYGLRAQDGRAVQKVEEHYLYELPTGLGSFVYYDGTNGVYDNKGMHHPLAGLTTDGNLVYRHMDAEPAVFFTICSKNYKSLVKAKNGCFLYSLRYLSLSTEKEVYFDGFEYVDLEGNTYERNELKIWKNTRD